MNFNQEIKSNTLILHISGDLIGEDNGVQLVEAVKEAISHKVMTCIIDISELRYINSSGIGVLITLLTKFRNKGGEVYLMRPIRKCEEVTRNYQAQRYFSGDSIRRRDYQNCALNS